MRSARFRAVLVSIVMLFAAAASATDRPAAIDRFDGARVSAVELRSDVRLDDADRLLSLVPLRPGDRWTAEALARGLTNLHASGIAGEIEGLLSEAEDGGVVVTYVLWGRLRVDSVELVGDLGLKPIQLRKVLEQREGTPLYEGRLIRGVYALQDLYDQNGYLEAVVRLDVQVDEARRRARVLYRIDAGPRARIASIRFEGGTADRTVEELRKVLKSKVGKGFNRQVAEDDAERLERWWVRAGRRGAVVRAPEVDYSSDADEVELVYPVEPGPIFEVTVAGAERKKLERKDLLPVLDDEGFDEALVQQTEERLIRHYQERGHYQVDVGVEVVESEERVEVRVAVAPGPEYELRSIEFRGNDRVPDHTLRALLSTTPRRLLGLGSGHLVDAWLEEDLDTLRSYYALDGHSQVEIGDPEIRFDSDQIDVVIPIEEGPRRLVTNLEVTGVSLDLDELLPRLALTAPGPYHPIRLEQSIDTIRSWYEERGYNATRVGSELDWDPGMTLVAVRLEVLEGPRNVVDRVLVRGLGRTSLDAVLRTVGAVDGPLARGEPIHRGSLLTARRALYRLGIFSRVEVEMAPGTPYTGARDVLIRVEEGRVRRLVYGAGFDSEDGIRGLLGASHSNLFGRAVSAQIDLRASSRESQARLLVRQPYVGRYPLPLSYSLFQIEEEEESFESRRRGAQVELRRSGEEFRLGLLYTYKVVEVDARAPELEPLSIDRNLREVELSSLTPTLLIDRRDDPIDPTRGWSSTISTEYAFPLLAADNEFLKLFAQQTLYVPLGRAGVVAGSVRYGAIESLRTVRLDPTLPPELASAAVPISERFFAGGRTTHRAFRRDSLGIPRQTLLIGEPGAADTAPPLVPVGGNGLLLFNLDYRFPIAGPVGGTLFFDTGNVWADWRDIEPGNLQSGVGGGLRFASPIGPVRLDVGWKLDPLPGQRGAVFFFSLGNPF